MIRQAEGSGQKIFMEATKRNSLKDKKRIVIKIGSSSLTHPETGELNLTKIEKLIRVLSDLRGEGKDVVLVSSGAIAAGRQAFGRHKKPDSLAEKQAFAAVGQARLMMVYQSRLPYCCKSLFFSSRAGETDDGLSETLQ